MTPLRRLFLALAWLIAAGCSAGSGPASSPDPADDGPSAGEQAQVVDPPPPAAEDASSSAPPLPGAASADSDAPAGGGPAPVRTMDTLDILLASVAYPGPTAVPTETPVAVAAVTGGSGLTGSSTQSAAPTRSLSGGSSSASSSSGSGGGSRSGPPTSTPVPTRPPPPTPVPPPTADTSVLAALRAGGLVIYLRHAQTDWTQNDRELAWVPAVLDDPGLFGDCDRQRLLSDAGRDQARAIGETVRRLGIPVGRVLSSPWCRTRETAELAFGGAEVAHDRLFDTGYLPAGSDTRSGFIRALRGLLSESPGAGANTFIVGHMPQLQEAAGVVLVEGEAAIVRPEGGGFQMLRANVGPGGWEGLR